MPILKNIADTIDSACNFISGEVCESSRSHVDFIYLFMYILSSSSSYIFKTNLWEHISYKYPPTSSLSRLVRFCDHPNDIAPSLGPSSSNMRTNDVPREVREPHTGTAHLTSHLAKDLPAPGSSPVSPRAAPLHKVGTMPAFPCSG